MAYGKPNFDKRGGGSIAMTTPSQQVLRSRLITRRSKHRLSSILGNKSLLGIVAFVLCYSTFVYRSLISSSTGIGIGIGTGNGNGIATGTNYAGLNKLGGANLRQTGLHVGNSSVNRHRKAMENLASVTIKDPSDTPDISTCEFRHYPPRRYYGLQESNQPDFLTEAEYIYGMYPVILSTSSGIEKLCVDQTAWLNEQDQGRLPFADGTNPSILHISRLKETDLHDGLEAMGVVYIATICMTNSQCQWQDSTTEIEEYKLSTRDQPNTVRTLLLMLNQHFKVIQESTISMVSDAVWGNKKRKPQPDGKGGFAETIRPLDDARLFVYNNKVWVSYRDGKAFGYDKQVLNPLHISLDGKVLTKASETITFCCGRNMALMTTDGSEALQSLTWVDPVTVIDVHTVAGDKQDEQRRRRLKEDRSTKKSHVHGTNAFMVPFGTNELLGMAHFHRPHDRNANPFARFGHHYTHAFFTISAQAPFRLKRLSSEFLLPSKHHPHDGEIIQFISGLEVVQNDMVVLAWGINDCEGAAGTIDVQIVESLLREVPEGKEVVDFMTKVTPETS